jgi:hypothetical protein
MGLELFLNSSIDLRGVEVEYKSEVEFEGIEEAGSESIIERELETIIAPLYTLQMEKQREIKRGFFSFSYLLCCLTRNFGDFENTVHSPGSCYGIPCIIEWDSLVYLFLFFCFLFPIFFLPRKGKLEKHQYIIVKKKNTHFSLMDIFKFSIISKNRRDGYGKRIELPKPTVYNYRKNTQKSVTKS